MFADDEYARKMIERRPVPGEAVMIEGSSVSYCLGHRGVFDLGWPLKQIRVIRRLCEGGPVCVGCEADSINGN